MKVHEVITRLQNFPMDANVYCYHEDTTWSFNGDYSEEIDIVGEDPVEEVIAYIPGQNDIVFIK